MSENFTISKPGTPGWVVVVAVVFCFVGVMGLIGAIGSAMGPGGQGEDVKQDAHYTATQFIERTYPGTRKVSGYRKSGVMAEGNVYTVVCEVEGVNGFGGPVRKMVGVEMELEGGKWRLREIVQR